MRGGRRLGKGIARRAAFWHGHAMIETMLHRFTREDYHRMGENGAISPDARVELLDGQIVDMFPLGPTHNNAVAWLNEQLSPAGRGRWVLYPQCSINLDDFFEPQPDFALVRPPMSRYRKDIPTPKDVFWLIEVSDSSLLSDRERKLPAYAAAGIKEVWIVNAQKKVVEVYRVPRPKGFAEIIIVKPGEFVSPLRFPDVVLDAAALFEVA